LVVLFLLVVLDALELGLEVQRVTHLVEQKGEEELTGFVSESDETLRLILVDRVAESVALHDDLADWAEHDARQVKVVEPPVVGLVVLNGELDLSHVVLVERDVVHQVHPPVEALIDVEVVLIKLGTDLELEGILVGIRVGEGVLLYDVAVIRVFLSHKGFLLRNVLLWRLHWLNMVMYRELRIMPKELEVVVDS